jgi:hypothetical protein
MSSVKDKYLTYEEENMGKNNFTMFAGGGSPSATSINKKHAVISVCASNGDSGILSLAALPGAEYWIENSTANSADLFPATGDKFESQAINTAYPIAAGECWHFKCITLGTWRIK